MKQYLVLLMIGVAMFLAGCEDVIEPEEQTEQLYELTLTVMLVDKFIPAIKVELSGEPKDLNIELKAPDDNVTTKRIYSDNFTQNSGEVVFYISEAGVLPLEGKYRVIVRDGGRGVASESLTLNGPDLVITEAEFNITGTTLHNVIIGIENKGNTPGFAQEAIIKVGDEPVRGWLFYNGIEPGEIVEINIPRTFNIAEDGSHINIWIYYKQKLVASYETDIYPE
jgi:hypothetical protein